MIMPRAREFAYDERQNLALTLSCFMIFKGVLLKFIFKSAPVTYKFIFMIKVFVYLALGRGKCSEAAGPQEHGRGYY